MNLYDKLDDAIMPGVNAGVRAWNWTTGGTKADFANTLTFFSLGGAGTGIIFSEASVSLPNAFFGALLYTAIPAFIYDNNQREGKELRAFYNMRKDVSVESEKGFSKTIGHVGLASSTLAIPFGYSKDKLLHTIGGIALLGQSLSFYVMAADPIFPRKNCISRGIEYLINKK